MDISRKNISETSVELTISVDEAELKIIKQKTLETLKGSVNAQGFRKGKAPTSIVEKQLDPELLQRQFMDDALSHFYAKAAMQEKLRVLEQPKIELKSFVPYTEFKFVATISVVPPVELGDYKKSSKKIAEVKISAKEVDEVVENLRRRAAETKPVQRAAQKEDEVMIDFDGKKEDGTVVAGASGKSFPLRIGSDSFIPGFEDEIIGLKKGDKKEFTITFPEDYSHKPLAKEKVIFNVEIKEVKEVVISKLDEEFVKKLGPFDTVEALKKDIKLQLTNQKSEEAMNAFKDEIVGDLVEKSKVVVPDVLLNDQISILKNDFQQNLTQRGITMKEYLAQSKLTEEEFMEKEMNPKAIKRVQAGLVLAEVADKENVTISDEEINIRIQLLKGQNPSQADNFDKEEVRSDIGSRMITEKTVEKLVEYITSKK